MYSTTQEISLLSKLFLPWKKRVQGKIVFLFNEYSNDNIPLLNVQNEKPTSITPVKEVENK